VQRIEELDCIFPLLRFSNSEWMTRFLTERLWIALSVSLANAANRYLIIAVEMAQRYALPMCLRTSDTKQSS
jgi:hypothetical protein